MRTYAPINSLTSTSTCAQIARVIKGDTCIISHSERPPGVLNVEEASASKSTVDSFNDTACQKEKELTLIYVHSTSLTMGIFIPKLEINMSYKDYLRMDIRLV